MKENRYILEKRNYGASKKKLLLTIEESLCEREISPLIAAWHYFVHISCNFRLDNSGENANFKREGFEREINFKMNIFNYTCW